MKIQDISPVISARTAVYPGDPPLSLVPIADFSKGDSFRLSILRTALHVGSHADAPSHYSQVGQSIDRQPLEPYIGPCQVVHVPCRLGGLVGWPDFMGVTLTQKRILIRTDSFQNSEVWNSDYMGLCCNLILQLADSGAILVGIDTPSIDRDGANPLLAHEALLKTNLAVLEGLDLSNTEPGDYFLCAQPLKIEGGDGSPVRAVLLEGFPFPT